MSKPLQQLIEDHKRTRRLLRYLQHQLSQIEASVERGDLHCIREVLDFMGSYPQCYHHPLEEAAMHLLGQRHPELAPRFVAIHQQHEELEKENRGLAALFEMIYQDHPVPMWRIKEQVNRYCDSQLAHLEKEDREILPLFKHYLSYQDWRHLRQIHALPTEPLFQGEAYFSRPLTPQFTEKNSAQARATQPAK